MALQGPLSLAVLQPLVDIDLAQIKYYWFAFGKFQGLPVMIARTGYTGEDGFEVYCPDAKAEGVWNALMESGAPHGLVPTGLGCRNTLRLEAKMALYGHEIDDTTNALEADLGWIIKLQKGDFLGRDALLKVKEQGLTRKLVGFRMLEKRDIARDHMDVLIDGRKAGYVTSGSPSTTCGCNLGCAYLPVSHAETRPPVPDGDPRQGLRRRGHPHPLLQARQVADPSLQPPCGSPRAGTDTLWRLHPCILPT